MNFGIEENHGVKDAIIYARVSSKSQTKRGDGLNSQQTRCSQYADYMGYRVADTFFDDLTGKRSDRPGILGLIAKLKADKRKRYVVIIDDVSRFARRVNVHFGLKDQITAAGGILESPSMIFRDDADGELHEYIVTSVAQHQARKNAEQTRYRREARCMNGFWPFQPPIGYKHEKVKGKNGKVIVRNEPIASIIQEGLEGYASGRFDTQVEVKRFFESFPDFPKDLPNGEIRNQRVTDILSRVIYAGYIEVPRWGISIREGQHKGLISLETHERIKDRLKGKKKAPARKDISVGFPLRGFVLCGDCSKPLTSCWSTSKTGKKHPYYMCFNRGCESNRKSIPRDRLEGDFETLLRSLKPSENLFQLARAMFQNAWDQRHQQASAQTKSFKREVIKLDRQIEQLVDKIVESENSTATSAYERRISKLEKEKLLIAERLLNKPAPKHAFEKMFELACLFLSNPWKLWASEHIEHKRTVLKLAFINRISYCRKKGFRTPEISLPFKLLGGQNMLDCEMARSGRFELPTPRFVVWCSIQLSYERLPVPD